MSSLWTTIFQASHQGQPKVSNRRRAFSSSQGIYDNFKAIQEFWLKDKKDKDRRIHNKFGTLALKPKRVQVLSCFLSYDQVDFDNRWKLV